jgi:enoyl-CoA hydratase/carnithine racemase
MRERLQRPRGEVAGAGWRRLRPAQQLILDLHELTLITVAAVNGPAAGYGVDLALACDFVVAADTAFFAMSYVQRGLVPDGGGMHFLPRRVGLARAKELILTGRRVDAAEALAIGLADRVVPAADLVASALAWAGELATAPPVATGLAKSILNRSLDLTAPEVLALSAQATAICYTTDDHVRLVESFLDARKKRD